MSQGESLHGYPNDNVVYKDEHGTSRIFDPRQYDAIDRQAVAFSEIQILYRQKVDPRIWFLLATPVRLQFIGPREVPRGRHLTQDKAVDWLLDNGKGIPPDIDFEDRYKPPTAFIVDAAERETDSERANKAKLFPKGVPSNTDLVDLVVRINAEQGSGKSLNQIAIDLIGNSTKAKSLLATIRRMKREGRVNL